MNKRSWFKNKFDIVLKFLLPLSFVAMIVCSDDSVAEAVGMSKPTLQAIALLVFLLFFLLEITFLILVVKRDWGWAWLPWVAIIRIFMIVVVTLSLFFILLMLAYRASSKEARDKALSSAGRRDYAGAIDYAKKYGDDANTAENYGAAGKGIWGWLVNHVMR